MCISVLIYACGCDLFPQKIYKPTNIQAAPSATESGIQWGGDKPKMIASIDSIVIECIPIENMKNEPGKSKGKSTVLYQIAATANISYAILDKQFFKKASIFRNPEANVIFEAQSTSGVVLGQSVGTIRLIENGTSAKASATIYGLTPEEIKKVVKVEARWEYGR